MSTKPQVIKLNLREAISRIFQEKSAEWAVYAASSGAFTFESEALLTKSEDIEDIQVGWQFFADSIYIQDWMSYQRESNPEILAALLLDEINSVDFPIEEPPRTRMVY